MKRVHYIRNKGQALLELAAWGGIMFIGASILVSYMLNLIYTQDIMMRNFRMAANFARQIGATGTYATLIHELIAHRKMPNIPFLPTSNYKEFKNISQVLFTRNMFYHISGDPDMPLTLVRIIVDGASLAKKMGISDKRYPHISTWLPPPMASSILVEDLFVLDLPVLDMIYSSTQSMVTGAQAIKSDPDRISEWDDADNLYQKSKEVTEFLDALPGNYEDQDSTTKEKIHQFVEEVLLSAEPLRDEDEIAEAAGQLERVNDMLGHDTWKGDLPQRYWEKDFIEALKGEMTIMQNNRGGKIKIHKPYTEIRVLRTEYGNNEIEWNAPDEEISW